MQKDTRFSNEFLNAFVDNQLDPEEKSRAYSEISQDEALNRQVCELRKLHDLVQLAYRDVPAPPAHAAAPAARRKGVGVAAAVAVLSLGIVLGTQIRMPVAVHEQVADITPAAVKPATATSTVSRPPPARAVPAARPAARSPSPVTGPTPATVAVAADLPDASAPRSINEVHIGNVRNKVLIHIAHDDPARLSQAMVEIEGLMRHYRDTRASAHVEVVINGRGLELVRVDTSAHAAEIARLLKEYDNLTFAACQNTIDRLKREQGITARLLPGVVVTDSGMAEITRRQHQGWTYLQV